MGVSLVLARTAQARARHIGLIDGPRKRTWAEVADRVSRGAGALHRLGIKPGGRVAVLAGNSDTYVELLAAVPWAGGAIVPMNTRWSEAELADGVRDCSPKLLIVDETRVDLGRRLVASSPEPVTLLTFFPEADDVPAYETLLAAADPLEDRHRTGDDLFGIFYTGGTTGRSKGVMLSHRNVLANAVSTYAEGYYRDDAVCLCSGGMFHASGTWPGVAVMGSGGTLVMMPSFVPGDALKLIAEHRITEGLLVPTMIQMLIEHEDFATTDISSIMQIIYGASPITETLLERAMAALPGVKFIQGYGQTEISPLAATLTYEHLLEGRAKGRLRAAGRATFGVCLRVVDPEDRPVPTGSVGEIVARGESVMLGYWNRPEETAETLRNGWLHTGDAGWFDDDGFLYVVDRVKDMIISGGENVYSSEVENALASHPAVQQCAVIGIPADKWGEQVHAIVRLHPGHAVSGDELIRHARSLIAGYKIPRSIEIRSEPFPLSPANKVLKRELRKPYWEGRSRQVN